MNTLPAETAVDAGGPDEALLYSITETFQQEHQIDTSSVITSNQALALFDGGRAPVSLDGGTELDPLRIDEESL